MLGNRIVAQDRQVRRDLAIEQAELLQLRTRQQRESVACGAVQELFEPSPVRLAGLQPGSGDHECNQQSA